MIEMKTSLKKYKLSLMLSDIIELHKHNIYKLQIMYFIKNLMILKL